LNHRDTAGEIHGDRYPCRCCAPVVQKNKKIMSEGKSTLGPRRRQAKKVTGAAKHSAEYNIGENDLGCYYESTISKGKNKSIDTERALRCSGSCYTPERIESSGYDTGDANP